MEEGFDMVGGGERKEWVSRGGEVLNWLGKEECSRWIVLDTLVGARVFLDA